MKPDFTRLVPNEEYRSCLRPDVKSTPGTWPVHFLTKHMVSGTGEPIFQKCSGNNMHVDYLQQLGEYVFKKELEKEWFIKG